MDFTAILRDSATVCFTLAELPEAASGAQQEIPRLCTGERFFPAPKLAPGLAFGPAFGPF
jgi:hypothetical protein